MRPQRFLAGGVASVNRGDHSLTESVVGKSKPRSHALQGRCPARLHWLRQHGESRRSKGSLAGLGRTVSTPESPDSRAACRCETSLVTGTIGRDRVAIALGQGRTAIAMRRRGQHQPDLRRAERRQTQPPEVSLMP